MDLPLISVVIPVYNGEKYIADAINSILKQNYSPLEIIVVDDGSTDNTQAVLEKFGNAVTVISQSNQGQSAARNVGLRATKGSVIGMLDADDLWTDDHIALMLPHLQPESPYDFVRGSVRYLKNHGTSQEETTEASFLEALVGACLYRTSLIERVGPFAEDMRQGEDLDWNIRITECGCREKRISETTLFYRRHEHNITNENGAVAQGYVHAFRKKLLRSQNKNNIAS